MDRARENGNIVEAKGACVDFNEVQRREYQAVMLRRKQLQLTALQQDDSDERPKDLFGIGLSGGGIRSASFCLGALQALEGFGLIRRADYLSTVSGGGYIGAGMVAAMTRQDGQQADFPYAVLGHVPPNGQQGNDMKDSEAVSHLRDHSRYLIPHGLSDILVSATILTRGFAVNLFLIFFLLMPLATMTILLNPTVEDLGHSAIYDILERFLPNRQWLALLSGEPLLATKVFGLAALVYFIGWGLWRSLPERHGLLKGIDTQKELSSNGMKAAGLFIVLLLAIAAVEIQGLVLGWLARMHEQAPVEQSSYQTFFLALSAFVIATASQQKRLAGWIEKGFNSPRFGMKLRSILSHMLLIAAALILPLLIYALYLQISLWGIQWTRFCPETRIATAPCFPPDAPAFISSTGTTMGLTVVAGLLILWECFVYLGRQSGRDTLKLLGRRLSDPRTRSVPVGLALLAMAAFLILAFDTTRTYQLDPKSDEIAIRSTVAANYVLASLIVVLLTINFANNANSLHRLYRDRLDIAFRLSGNNGSLQLQDLGDTAPYLLINATLNARLSQRTLDKNANAQTTGNAARGRDPAMRGRNAEFFLFSKLFTGSDTTHYAPTTLMSTKDPQLNLASAVAISGAAVSSSMGRVRLGLLSPTLALLNLRLGYWLHNPRYASTSIADMRSDLPWHDFLGAYLIAESFGLLRADSSKVYVTDGGHIDNIGLYQLLKRQCDQIIIIDAESDPALNFGALVDVQRFARIDLGYRITLDWPHLRDAAVAREAVKGMRLPIADSPVHDCHFAIGTIDYGNGRTGRLLYIKAVVTGDEPDYVLDYERRYPAFPHEATNDQFFSEEQMEAYRALGFHAVRRALSEPKIDVPVDDIPDSKRSLNEAIKDLKRDLGVTVARLS